MAPGSAGENGESNALHGTLTGSAELANPVAGAGSANAITNDGPAGPGTRFGDYVVEGEHARGGLGRILRAHDRRLGRPVAIKELLRVSKSSAARFAREARVTARLLHPNIVPVYGAGTRADGTAYYAMKFIAGKSLKELVAEAPALQDRLSLLPHVVGVADAIAFAHSQGILHRDLKPSNVLVGAFGETVVIDWGLAKDLLHENNDDELIEPSESERGGADSLHTMAGIVIGTPSYMPPEQAEGQRVDVRADVYALGALLYHVIAGVAPFSGITTDEVLAQARASSPVPLRQSEPSTPAPIAAIVSKAMARDASARYATAADLASDLRRYVEGVQLDAALNRLDGVRKSGAPLSRRGRSYAIGAAMVVAIAGAALFFGVRSEAPRQGAPPPMGSPPIATVLPAVSLPVVASEPPQDVPKATASAPVASAVPILAPPKRPPSPVRAERPLPTAAVAKSVLDPAPPAPRAAASVTAPDKAPDKAGFFDERQ